MCDKKCVVINTADLDDEDITRIKNTFMDSKHNHLNRELDMNLHDTDTFNKKPIWRNVLAVIFGVVGIYFLMQAWVYHMLVQLVTMPQDKWIAPLAEQNVPATSEYPNKFCDVLCTVEATMIHQLGLLRTAYGEEYCQEDNTGEDNVERV